MKKLIILSILTLISSVTSYAQWVTKTVDNKLDPVYRIAYCSDLSNKALLKLEKVEDELAFYMMGTYFCDDYIEVDIALVVNGQSKVYSITANKSSNSKALFLVDNLLAEDQASFLADLKACSSAVVRTNETHCSSDIFKFNMTGSTKAVTFMSN